MIRHEASHRKRRDADEPRDSHLHANPRNANHRRDSHLHASHLHANCRHINHPDSEDQRHPAPDGRAWLQDGSAPRTTSANDDRIAVMVSRQHGVVTRAQLLAAGLTPAIVDHRVRAGRLRPLHRGVYLHGLLMGPLVPPWAREMAAALACGPGAAVSHENAARLWGLLPAEPGRGPVHVTIPGADRGRRPGIRPHRVASLPDDERALLEGVPLTAPARTLVDIAGRVRPRALEQALAEAERNGLADLGDVAALLERRPHVRGAAALRRLLASCREPALTRSSAEEQLLALIRSGGLPAPETNVQVGGSEVDFLWRDAGVVVEVDGFAYHSSRRNFESDRRRDARLAARGLRVIRLTWRQLVDEPQAVLVRLAQILALARL